MKTFKIFYTLIFSLLILQSCDQDNIEQVETKTTVVEAYLHAGQTIDSLKVTQSYSYGQVEEGIKNIDDLEIIISKEGNQIPLTSIGNGIYNNENFVIEAGKSYQLIFENNDEIISAETYVPEQKVTSISTTEVKMEKIEAGVLPSGGFGDIPEPVELSWENEEGDYYYVVIKNIEEDPEYVNENTVQFGNQLVFISEPQLTDYYAINTRRELTQFGTYQIAVYRVNPEYVSLYESSGNSTLSLEQPPTNIENGLGIFTGVSSHTHFLEVSKK